MKWAGGLLAVVLVAGLVMSAQDDSCVETAYSGGRLIRCESAEIFQPAREGETPSLDDAPRAGVASVRLPPRVMAFLGALLHGRLDGSCETSTVPEGQWTVCNDGFSLLERGPAPVAMALFLRPNENPVAKAERAAAAARAEIDLPVKDSDCGPFPCSAYLRDEEDPKRDDYLLELSNYEIARLGAMIRAWDEQEVDRELEEARAENTALQARLEEIEAHEARVVSAETPAQSAQVSAETVARAGR